MAGGKLEIVNSGNMEEVRKILEILKGAERNFDVDDIRKSVEKAFEYIKANRR